MLGLCLVLLYSVNTAALWFQCHAFLTTTDWNQNHEPKQTFPLLSCICWVFGHSHSKVTGAPSLTLDPPPPDMWSAADVLDQVAPKVCKETLIG